MELSAERIMMELGDSPLQVRKLVNRATGRMISRAASQFLVIRPPSRISEPIFLTEVGSLSATECGARLLLTDSTGKYGVTLSISPGDQGFTFVLQVHGPSPIWSVEWTLSGLDLDEVIIPALGGQRITRGMPTETRLSFKYPFWWNAQFTLGSVPGGGIWVYTREAQPKFKLVRIRREREGFAITLGFEADAPLISNTMEVSFHVDCYAGGWEVPVDIHRRWMETAFGLSPLREHEFCPSWVHGINFILEMWGMSKDNPSPLHTFDDMQNRLRAFARLHDPSATLVYLPGFAEHGIDSRAPSYNPSLELGGDQKFESLIAAAHAMGYRVMLHTNVLGMAFDHPQFDRFRNHQVVDAFGRLQGWGLDMDGDWLPEPYFAYINPGVRQWGDLMVETIGDLLTRFGVDAIFLDQTLLAFNVSAGPNFIDGMREHISRLQRHFPTVLFAGEGLHEQVLRPLPMAQIHGIDSIAEIHGAEGDFPWRSVHPVSVYLFGKYTRFTAHLLTRHPSHPIFKRQEAAYAQLGVIPALCLYNKKQPMNLPAVRSMIKRAYTLG